MGAAEANQDKALQPAGAARPALRSVVSAEPGNILQRPWRQAVEVRQSFLEALPIAAAVVGLREGRLSVLAANRRYANLDAFRPNGEPMPIISCPPVARALRAFLGEEEGKGDPADRFDWRDGEDVGGRHFQVHLARLAPMPGVANAGLLTLLDRTAEIESARSLRAELLHDSLTGLPNRTAFTEAVDELVAKGRGRGHAVLLVDLARFSRINESLGGVAGDELLITVARRLVSALRAGDLLARVGGDEFGMLIRLSRGSDDAVSAARRMQGVLSTPFRLAGFEIGVECAIGCVALGEDKASGEEIVRDAQLALKRAKTTGRIELHRPGESASALYQLDVETELRRAIDMGDLRLAYQPIIDLASGRVTGFEALARWDHPTRGTIEPSEFIPVAEEAGLIVPLGRWALGSALGALAGWDRAAGRALPLGISVNLSAIQIARGDVPGMIAGALAAHGIGGERLTVELTESVIVHDPERAARVLQALKALDIRIAMDDFGTGYSSLNYLRRLPIDILKIDRSFVSGMLADRDKVAIVRAVLSLADALGKSTTAEGVETVELSQTLAALGCSHGQGYHYAAPLSADKAFEFWKARAG